MIPERITSSFVLNLVAPGPSCGTWDLRCVTRDVSAAAVDFPVVAHHSQVL